ncbi:Heme A synthase, cytochrome oxidase biogenesis protein Cox15-CtaA [hydrothermal vent metagenome]|uniref:Heme A synthase, cytochrome oxidase biogenesis protein Cox15-CtaA n=1 Tax=hydrothermal vent metagenome TaxID=652676 RepID=A0A3B0YYG2_9ZZZZ
MDLKHKLTKALFLTTLVISSVILLLILFQPTNIVADEGVKTSYSSMFGWVGVIFALPLAWFLVKNDKPSDIGSVGLVFHYLGLIGTQASVVAIVYLLFAIGGYTIPNHIINLSAYETYEEKVEFIEYRVSTGSYVNAKQRPWLSFPDEFIIIRYANGRKVPLIVNNTFGSNKLDVSKVKSKYEKPVFPQHRQSVIRVQSAVVLNGRRHTLGHTIDSISLQ